MQAEPSALLAEPHARLRHLDDVTEEPLHVSVAEFMEPLPGTLADAHDTDIARHVHGNFQTDLSFPGHSDSDMEDGVDALLQQQPGETRNSENAMHVYRGAIDIADKYPPIVDPDTSGVGVLNFDVRTMLPTMAAEAGLPLTHSTCRNRATGHSSGSGMASTDEYHPPRGTASAPMALPPVPGTGVASMLAPQPPMTEKQPNQMTPAEMARLLLAAPPGSDPWTVLAQISTTAAPPILSSATGVAMPTARPVPAALNSGTNAMDVNAPAEAPSLLQDQLITEPSVDILSSRGSVPMHSSGPVTTAIATNSTSGTAREATAVAGHQPLARMNNPAQLRRLAGAGRWKPKPAAASTAAATAKVGSAYSD